MTGLLVMGLSLATAAATMVGGLFALRLEKRLALALGFSAGAVVGVAFFDLLPEALQLDSGNARMVIGLAALGFFIYAALDRFTGHKHEGDAAHDMPRRGFIGAASFSIHSLLDGLALGLAFQAGHETGITVAAAVLAHDFADGLNTVNVVVKNGASRRAALSWLAADASAPILGAAISLAIAPPQAVLALALAGFAGVFLYIGACDLFPASQRARPGAATLIASLCGAAFLYLATRIG